jgi:14-3-3 protein epsilon
MQRKLLNARIKWAESSGRHQTMLDNVRALIKEASDQGFELTPEERNLVSFAYKNVVSQLRQQWRTLVQTELSWMDGYNEGKDTNNGKHNKGKDKDRDKNNHNHNHNRNRNSTEGNATHRSSKSKSNHNSSDDEEKDNFFDIDDDLMIKKKWDERSPDQLRRDHYQEYLTAIEQKLFQICNELEVTVLETLLPSTGEHQGKVFFRKMLADYSRYLSERLDGVARKERAEKALMSYKLAATMADNVLNPTDPVRLGLSLNFSVFYWEILGFKDRARQVAKAAFDDAAAELDLMGEHDHHESTMILELINENLDLWKRHDGDLVYLPEGGNGNELLGNGLFDTSKTGLHNRGGANRNRNRHSSGNHTIRKNRK